MNAADLPNGVTLHPSFVDASRERELLDLIDNAVWDNTLKRRVQHYGWRYDYRARKVLPGDYLGPLPIWLQSEAARLRETGLFAQVPDQAIINEYLPGQGISAHIDCEPCFGDQIASLSLGSRCCMTFQNHSDGQRIDITIPPQSLLLLQGEGRSQWSHAIPARKSDMIDGARHMRHRRVSITFRTVKS
ncbi:MAG: alpha-ketoglutarate-dependent dioxygenase AlkB [Pseudomonadota bacterium]